jgi:hypothetical protein
MKILDHVNLKVIIEVLYGFVSMTTNKNCSSKKGNHKTWQQNPICIGLGKSHQGAVFLEGRMK